MVCISRRVSIGLCSVLSIISFLVFTVGMAAQDVGKAETSVASVEANKKEVPELMRSPVPIITKTPLPPVAGAVPNHNPANLLSMPPSKQSRADMIAEGSVTVYSDQGTVTLDVTLVRSGEQQSQRILLKQADGKLWDGIAAHLTPEGLRALIFLDSQYSGASDAVLAVANPNASKEETATTRVVSLSSPDGKITRYTLDKSTSRVSKVEFEQGQQLDAKGQPTSTPHAFAYGDYRSAGAIFTPFTVEHRENGVKREELNLTKANSATSSIPAPNN